MAAFFFFSTNVVSIKRWSAGCQALARTASSLLPPQSSGPKFSSQQWPANHQFRDLFQVLTKTKTTGEEEEKKHKEVVPNFVTPPC